MQKKPMWMVRAEVGGKYFDDFKDHPRKINCIKYKEKDLCSSAAGRYQFLSKTWDRYAESAGVKNFKPLSQDKVAVKILEDEGALELLFEEPMILEAVIAKINRVWASLPGSPYGQPTRSFEELAEVFYNRLVWHKLPKAM